MSALASRSPIRRLRLGWSSRGSRDCGVGGEVRHRRGVAAAVVVEHDDHRTAAVTEVVERLVGDPAGHRPVADHGDDVAVLVGAGGAGHGHPVRVREHRRRVAVLDVVVGALLATRVARQPAGLAQLVEPVAAAGDDLVDVGLVAGVPQDRVGRRFEHPVQRERQLDGAEVGAEVSAALGDGVDDEVADLAGQVGELRRGEPAQIGGLVDPFQQHAESDATRDPDDALRTSGRRNRCACSAHDGRSDRGPPIEPVAVPAVQAEADDDADAERQQSAEAVDPVVVAGHDDAEQRRQRIQQPRRSGSTAGAATARPRRRTTSTSRCAGSASRRTGSRSTPSLRSRTTTGRRTRRACRRSRTRPRRAGRMGCTRRRTRPHPAAPARGMARRAGAAASTGRTRSRRSPARS